MQLFLIFVALTIGIALAVATNPTERNIQTVKFGAIACVVAGVCALIWPEQVMGVCILVWLYALACMFFQALLWPVRFLGEVLHGKR